MRILYISQYFPPEAGATQTRAYEMAKTWVQMGHQVTMLTEFPNHPSGIIPPQYRGKFWERSVLDGIEVIRVWVKASPEKNFRNRMLFYLSFMFNAILAGIFKVSGKFNFIYATSPPLFAGAAGLVISYLTRTPLVFEVRDLWPESAVALGELKNHTAISLATKLELACYRRAVQVIVVTKGIYNRLLQRGIPTEKLVFNPNGANTEMFRFSQNGRDQIRHELGLDEKFVAVYAGIHGLAQGLETVFKAAEILKPIPQFRFVLIGDGPKKAELLALAETMQLPNLTLLDEKPRELMPDYLSAADIVLVPLRRSEIFKGALPSKIFDAWACNRPVLLSIDGEARELVESISGGVFVDPEDPVKMAAALQELATKPSDLLKMGENGRNFTVQYHSRQSLAEILIQHLQKCLTP